MAACDPRALVHLAQAQESLSAALALLGAEAAPQVELPAGVERPERCAHPKEKIHRPLGGRPWCGACGEKL